MNNGFNPFFRKRITVNTAAANENQSIPSPEPTPSSTANKTTADMQQALLAAQNQNAILLKQLEALQKEKETHKNTTIGSPPKNQTAENESGEAYPKAVSAAMKKVIKLAKEAGKREDPLAPAQSDNN